MNDHLKRHLLLGVALAAVIAGVIIAVASSGGHHHATKSKQGLARGSGPGDVQLAAQYLGISRAELRRHLRTGETMAEVADSVPGHSASGLVAALLAPRAAHAKAQKPSSAATQEAIKHARAQVTAEAGHRRGRTGPVAPAAAYLGLSEPALRAKLQAGQSLAEVATAQKKSQDGLIAALIAVKARRLKTALQEHAVTPAQERAALSRLGKRVRRQIDAHLASPSG
jgi:hypothetical protein